MPAPLICTLTGNLLAETTLTFDVWNAGKTQRAKTRTFQVGGKGINVSKMLARLGAATRALCFTGGENGSSCRAWLEKSGIPHQTFDTATETRAGLVVRSGNQPETTFLGPDAPVCAASLKAAAAELDALPDDAVLAFCGSFPGFDKPSAAPLQAALTRRTQKGRVYVDTYGPALSWWIEQPVALVKINRDEFDALVTESERSLPLPQRLQAALERWPAQAWIVTDGPNALHAITRGGRPELFTPPLVKEVSATGSGDVFLAALLAGIFHNSLTLNDAIPFAMPFGAANASSPGVADFDLNLLPSIRSDKP